MLHQGMVSGVGGFQQSEGVAKPCACVLAKDDAHSAIATGSMGGSAAAASVWRMLQTMYGVQNQQLGRACL
jgi:hypothetical protein